MKRSRTIYSLLLVLFAFFSFGTAQASGLFWFGTGYLLGNSGSDHQRTQDHQRTLPAYDPSIFWVADSATLASVTDPLLVKVLTCDRLPCNSGAYAVYVKNCAGESIIVDPKTLTPRSLFIQLIGDTSTVTLLRVRQIIGGIEIDNSYLKYVFEYIDRPQPDPFAYVRLGTTLRHK